jgi:hypothetical protein
MKKTIASVMLILGITSVIHFTGHVQAKNSVILSSNSTLTLADNNQAKVIVVVNSAAWCGVCKKNGPRLEQAILPAYMKDSNYQVIVNDLSDDKTKAASNKMLADAGLVDFDKEHKSTGLIYFIDAQSKKQISSISVSKTDEEIIKAFNQSLN